jgi:hypothetical protein
VVAVLYTRGPEGGIAGSLHNMKSDYQFAADIVDTFRKANIPEVSSDWYKRGQEKIEVEPGVLIDGPTTSLLPAGERCALVHHGWGDILLRFSYGAHEHLLWFCATDKDTLVGMGEIGDGGLNPPNMSYCPKLHKYFKTKGYMSMFPHPFYQPIDWLGETQLRGLWSLLNIKYRPATVPEMFEDPSQLVAMSGIYQKGGDTGTSGAYLFVVHKFIRKMTASGELWNAIATSFNSHFGQKTLYDLHTTCPISSKIMALPQVTQALKSGTWPLLYREVGQDWMQSPWE